MPAGRKQRAGLDLGDVRAANTLLALGMLWAQDVSRAELARRTGLSRSTISAIVDELVESRLVEEAGPGESLGGRRPTLLRLRERAALVLGVDVGQRHLTVGVLDLLGRPLADETLPHPVEAGPGATRRLAMELVERCLARAGEPLSAVAFVGVGVPGPVGAGGGTLVQPPNMPGWDGVAVPAWLGTELGVPVVAENDANAAALAEARFGAGRNTPDLVYLKAATGVGAGIVVGGRLFRGARGGAGELGHVSINEAGPPGPSGNPGSLESYASVPVIEAAARSRALAGERTTLPDGADLAAIARAADGGDPLARSVLEEAGAHLGVAVATLLNLLNPSLVVLGGRLALAGEHVLGPVRRVVGERTLKINREAARLVLSELGPRAGLQGAGALALGELNTTAGLDRLLRVAARRD